MVSCNIIQYKDVNRFLKTLDVQAKQVILKFYILSYDDSLKDERGLKFASVYKNASNAVQIALNTLVFPVSISRNILSSTSFYSALRLLNTSHILNINQFPFVLVKNNIPFKFQSVQNVPYLVKSTVTDSNTVQNNSTYEYKDVGLKIQGITNIYKDFVSLNLNLTIEDIVSLDTFTPVTNKRYLSSITNLKIGQVLVLTGIKQTKHDKTNIKIPFLCNIPFIGKMFQYKYTTNTNSNISIAIQVIQSNMNDANGTLSPSEVRASDKER
jgi:general secretion pathway protein D